MDIKINKSAHGCAVCEREFVHDEKFLSLVNITEEGLIREDYCAECWDENRGKAAYSVWNPKFYDPKVAEQEPVEVFSPLRQLFYEAVDAEERPESAKAFLAAQLLRRQKVFRLVKESDETDGEVRLLLYTDRIGNRLIEVRDPNFSYAELENARGGLLQRLRELEAPEEIKPEDSNEAAGEETSEENSEETGVENEKETRDHGENEIG